MAKLPLVQADPWDRREWLQPVDIREAFRIQPRFVKPDFKSLQWTVLSTVLPGTFFVSRLLPRSFPCGQAMQRRWHCGVCLLWACGALLGLVVASCRNPGVVPRVARNEWPATDSQGMASRCIYINGIQVKQRWCKTCKVYRPLRSKHCAHCDRCVFRFDHHCTWLGNCVGLGNYRSFLGLITTASLFFGHSALITVQVLWRELHQAQEMDVLAGDTVVPDGLVQNVLRVCKRLFLAHGTEVLYIAYACVLFLSLLVLALYHLIIIACNMTTNEHVRDYYVPRNPFDLGCVDNCAQVFCAPYGRVVQLNRSGQSNGQDVLRRAEYDNFGSTPSVPGVAEVATAAVQPGGAALAVMSPRHPSFRSPGFDTIDFEDDKALGP